MREVLAIDPGTVQSAWVRYDPVGHLVVEHGIWPNHLVADSFRQNHWMPKTLLIEKIESYGMPVGAEVFETVFWVGRFAEAAHLSIHMVLVPRRDVKLTLCGSARANDAAIRQALIDRFGPGKETAIGTKAKPGPLYGIKGDEWAALAVAVSYGSSSPAWSGG